MNRREFLLVAGAAALAGVAAVVDACAGPGPSGAPGPRSAGPSAGPSGSAPAEPSIAPPPVRSTAMSDENRRPGDRGWDVRDFGTAPGVEAHLDAASVAPGDVLTLRVAGSGEVTVDWYRLGWYDGLGGRRMRRDEHVRVAPAGPLSIDRVSGRAEAAFEPALSFAIPADWPSGAYRAVVRPARGAPGCAPFVVRPAPDLVAPVLFVSAATTWQAYNVWGGADLYDASTADTPATAGGLRATQVSFDRPYFLELGNGYQGRWELPFVRWQEREGRAADMCADLDLELHPEIVTGRRLIVFAGHHEYWSRPMRATLEGAIANGTNVAFLSANEVYWQARFEPSGLGQARRVTCYKSRVKDPITATDPALTTCRWRETPVDEPEATLIGQMYGHIVERSADWVVTGSDHWLYAGTGLRDGDRLINLVGQEYDTFFPQFAPPGTTILASSPVVPRMQGDPEGGRSGQPAAPQRHDLHRRVRSHGPGRGDVPMVVGDRRVRRPFLPRRRHSVRRAGRPDDPQPVRPTRGWARLTRGGAPASAARSRPRSVAAPCRSRSRTRRPNGLLLPSAPCSTTKRSSCSRRRSSTSPTRWRSPAPSTTSRTF